MRKLEINLEVLEDLEFGLDAIAYTDEPAIERIGLAFNDKPKELFTNEPKMRISGPLMLVKDIYRKNVKGEEYEIVFTYESNKALVEQFKRKMTTFDKETLFNDDHNGNKGVKAYILNMMFMESQSEIDYIKDKYDFDMNLGDVWLDTQVQDRETYDYLVQNNKIGFSVEAIFKLDEIIEKQVNNMSKDDVKKEFTDEQLDLIRNLFNLFETSKFAKEEDEEKEDEKEDEKKELESEEDEKEKEEDLIDKTKEDEKKEEELESNEEDEVDEVENEDLKEILEMIGEIRAEIDDIRSKLPQDGEDEEDIKEEFSIRGLFSKK